MTKREHPEALRPLLPELTGFAEHNHLNVLYNVLRFGTSIFSGRLINVYLLGSLLAVSNSLRIHLWRSMASKLLEKHTVRDLRGSGSALSH